MLKEYNDIIHADGADDDNGEGDRMLILSV